MSFLDDLKTHFKGEKSRTLSFDKFLKKGLPDKSWENFQYVPINDLYEEKFTLPQSVDKSVDKRIEYKNAQGHIYPECQGSTLVFVNGEFKKELSFLGNLPESMLVLPLSLAEVKFSAFLMGKVDENDPFSLLNHSLYKEGVFLYLPPNLNVEVPIQILHVYTEKALFSPRVHLFLGKQSSLNLYVSEVSKCDSGWINSGIDIHMEERSELKLYTLYENKKEMFHTESIRCDQKKGSRFKAISAGSGKKIWRQNFKVSLGFEADASLSGVFCLNGKDEAHIHTLVCHKEENSTSFQKFKGVLHGQSRLSFEGKIFVEQKALKTEAYQLNNNLILSEHARVYSKPNLEIFADDVKASHGATSGKLSDEDLFYLTSKGLPKEMAKQLLIEGFYKEILSEIPISQARKSLEFYAKTS